jgi:hypothetical protein
MSVQPIKQHKKWLVLPAVALTVASLFVARAAFAKLTLNTIHPQAIVSDNGRQLIVTGPCQTDAVQQVFIHVTITQRSTGAVGEGITTFTGTGNPQQWEVHAVTQGRETFTEGPATATALARTAIGQGLSDDAHQWLVNITLVRP